MSDTGCGVMGRQMEHRCRPSHNLWSRRISVTLDGLALQRSSDCETQGIPYAHLGMKSDRGMAGVTGLLPTMMFSMGWNSLGGRGMGWMQATGARRLEAFGQPN